MKITKLQLYVLKYIMRKIIKQSPHHRDNIKQYLEVLVEASRKEFYEDSKEVNNNFLASIMAYVLTTK